MTQPMFNNNEKKEEVCGWCSVGNRECDCDKCGVTGCFECVSGYHGLNETLNLCPECEEESDEEELPMECGKCGNKSFKYSTEIFPPLGDDYYCFDCISGHKLKKKMRYLCLKVDY